MTLNVYETPPTYETDSFLLRLVQKEDSNDLLICYSDTDAISKMNADFCTSDFHFGTIKEMDECIDFWLKEYTNQAYVRLSIIAKATNRAVGTVEIFGGTIGVLRIDIVTQYETQKYLDEIFKLAVFYFIHDFHIGSLKIKASNTPNRVPLLVKYGFIPDEKFRPELGYYERPHTAFFDTTKGMAYCGLACCVCSENRNCNGCRNDGCTGKEWCEPFKCCKEKQINGCWECTQFPCDTPMLNKLRVRTFSKLLLTYGEEKLVQALKENEHNGMLYHYRKQLVGDYDLMQNEEDVIKLIMRGLDA